MLSLLVTVFVYIFVLNYIAGKASFTKKKADLSFLPDFADDFPVAMQVCICISISVTIIVCCGEISLL